MTVIYNTDMPVTFSSYGWFKAVVFRWRGSVFKMVASEMLILVLLWYALFFMWYILDPETQHTYGVAIKFLREYQASNRTLLSLMLVFYYQQIYARAKAIFFTIPFPDSPFFVVAGCVNWEQDEAGHLLRATVFRYILSSTFLVYHGISARFRHEYADPFVSLVKLGLLTDSEVVELDERFIEYPYLSEISCIPLVWASQRIQQSFADGVGGDPQHDKSVLLFTVEAIKDYRTQCASVLFQVYLPFPVLLSQLVTVLVYCQLLLTCVAMQNSHQDNEMTFYVPLFMSLECLVYIRALRVGQIYTNPLGADDDDYEIVSFFSRNLRLAYIYGLYGQAADIFDISANLPPLVSLSGVQQKCLPAIPVEFYSVENSKTGVFATEPTAPTPATIEQLTLARAAKNRKSLESFPGSGLKGRRKGGMPSSSSEPCLNPLVSHDSMSDYIALQ